MRFLLPKTFLVLSTSKLHVHESPTNAIKSTLTVQVHARYSLLLMNGFLIYATNFALSIHSFILQIMTNEHVKNSGPG